MSPNGFDNAGAAQMDYRQQTALRNKTKEIM